MHHANINPEILKWARKRSSLSVEELAEAVKVTAETLRAIERGKQSPAFKKAQLLATKLHIPFGYFFLPSPPDDTPPLPDLRTIKGAQRDEFSPDFMELLNNILRKQQWYKEYLLAEEVKPLEYIGRFRLTSNAEDVARDIRVVLEINSESRKECANWEGFLRSMIQRAEAQGILILRSGIVGNNARRKLSVEEFRGFAITDPIAPLIFINGNDSKAAQVFTLAHELAHLWIGESGISNFDLHRQIPIRNKKIEVYCNQVAADVLAPRKEFIHNWSEELSIEENVNRLVRLFRVSSLVVLRRAFDFNLINYDEYSGSCRAENENTRPAQKSSSGDFYNTLYSRNSNSLVEAVVSSTINGRLLLRDAADFLSVRVNTVQRIADKMSADGVLGA